MTIRNLLTKEIYTMTAKKDYTANDVIRALAKHLDVKTNSLVLLDMGDERYPSGSIVKRIDKVSRELAFVFNEFIQFSCTYQGETFPKTSLSEFYMKDGEVIVVPMYGCGVVPKEVKFVDLIAGLGDVKYNTKTWRLSYEDDYFKACAESL